MTDAKRSATRSEVSELHEILTKTIKDQIAEYKKNGEPMPASFLKEVREFLKDNGVEACADQNPDLREVVKEVDFGFEGTG